MCRLHGKGQVDESVFKQENELLNIEVSLQSRDADSDREERENRRYLLELRNEHKLSKVDDDLKRTLLWHKLAI